MYMYFIKRYVVFDKHYKNNASTRIYNKIICAQTWSSTIYISIRKSYKIIARYFQNVKDNVVYADLTRWQAMPNSRIKTSQTRILW